MRWPIGVAYLTHEPRRYEMAVTAFLGFVQEPVGVLVQEKIFYSVIRGTHGTATGLDESLSDEVREVFFVGFGAGFHHWRAGVDKRHLQKYLKFTL